MNKLILLLLATLLHSGGATDCYICSSNVDLDTYDADCATNGYDGHHGEHELTYSCFTEFYEDGSVERSWDQYIHGEGECMREFNPWYNMMLWRCYCSTDLCNNNNCQHCHLPSTQDTTTDVTKTTAYNPDATTTTNPSPGDDIACYICSSDYNMAVYDPKCANNGYDGYQGENALAYGCYTEVYEDGSVERYWDENRHENGKCLWVEDFVNYWRCYCDTDLCNNNNCQHCYETTTQSSTTEGSTQTPTTYKPDITTTTIPSEGLTCYSCLDCPTVDSNTLTVTDSNFQTCVTGILGSETLVMRSGDPDLYSDGECIHEDGGMFCYCTTNLCNDGGF